MPYEVAHEYIEEAEEAANKRAEIQREIIKKQITKRILEGWKKIKELEEDISVLASEEDRLKADGKMWRARFVCWKARRMQAKLDMLKHITPSKESLL